jgi:hypothetical protein
VDQIYGQRIAEIAKKTHSNEAFYALNDPLDAALFPVFVDLMRERNKFS